MVAPRQPGLAQPAVLRDGVVVVASGGTLRWATRFNDAECAVRPI